MEARLRDILQIDDRQYFGFMKGRSTIDAIYIRQVQEKYREKKKKLFHVFVDLEKAFDRVSRNVIETGH